MVTGRGLRWSVCRLAGEAEHPVAGLVGDVVDVPAESFGDAQAVVDDHRRGAWSVGLGGAEEPAELVPVEADGRCLVVDVGPAYPGDGEGVEEFGVPDGVLVELRQARRAAGDGGRRGGPAGARLGHFGKGK